MNRRRALTMAALIFITLSTSLPAASKMTPQEVMELHNATKKNVDEVVNKTKGFIDKVTEWAGKLQEWSDKFDSLARDLQETYEKDFDKTTRDLQIVKILEKYEDPRTLGPLKISLKEKLASTQNLGEALATIGNYKRIVADRIQALNEKAGALASQLKITEDTLKDASEYLKTAQTASKVYDLLNPDAKTAFTGLERIGKILKEGASYFPPPLDKAVGAYADVTEGFVTALKALDSKIQANAYQGATTAGGEFSAAWQKTYNDVPPAGIRRIQEYREIDPSQVYVDEIDQKVYSLEGGQIIEFGVAPGQVQATYDHYMKILPIIREKVRSADVKIPIARFRIACRASNFGDNVGKVDELIRKDLRDLPGEAVLLSSIIDSYFEAGVAGKVSAAVTGKGGGEEEKGPSKEVRSQIGFSEGELASLRNSGTEALNAALGFRDDVEVKDLGKKASNLAKSSLPQIDVNVKKLTDQLAGASGETYAQLSSLRGRWQELYGFYTWLADADTGLYPQGANVDKVKRFNTVLRGEYVKELTFPISPKYPNLSGSLEYFPILYGPDYEGFEKGKNISADRAGYKRVLEVAAGKGSDPMDNERIDDFLKRIESKTKEYTDLQTWLEDWKKRADTEYKEMGDEAKKRTAAFARVKSEVEAKYNFKIVLPQFDTSAREAWLGDFLGKLESKKKQADTFYSETSEWVKDFINGASGLKGALQRAKEMNTGLAQESKALSKEIEVYGVATRKYLQVLHHNFDLIQSYYISTDVAGHILAEAQTKLSEVDAKVATWKQKGAKMKERAEGVPFATISEVVGYGFDPRAEINDASTTWNLSNAYTRLYEIRGMVAERRIGNRILQAKSEEERRKYEAEEAKKPHAEIPVASVRVCGKLLANGSVSIAPSDLVDGKLVIEGSLANVRNGAVDQVTYLINNVDYGRGGKGGNPWKLMIAPKELPKYDRLDFAVVANIGGTFRSQPARFTVNYAWPEKERRAQMGTLMSDTQLDFRLNKARDLFRAVSTMNSYFKMAISKNDINFAKSLYLAARDKRDESATNKSEADDIYAGVASEGSPPADVVHKYKQAGDYDFDVRNFFTNMEKTLSTYVPDLANLKEASGNVGEGYNIEDIVAGRGPAPAGGGTSQRGTSEWAAGSDFDFSAGGINNNPNESDLALIQTADLIARPSNGAVRDMGTSDFSTAPTLSSSSDRSARVAEGHLYAVLTGEGNYAKFKIARVNGTTSITIDWAYQPNGSTTF